MDNSNLADLRYLSYAEWISGDYIEFVKKSVLPSFNKRYKLKLREARVLNTIASATGTITGSDISEFLRQDPATITRSLVILIGEGYVTSHENLKDGRSRILKTTQKGQDASQFFLSIFSESETLMRSKESQIRFHHDDEALTQSLQLVAERAKLFRESQRELSRMLRNRLNSTAA